MEWKFFRIKRKIYTGTLKRKFYIKYKFYRCKSYIYTQECKICE